MGVKGRTNLFDSSKIEVGEIDTRAPFASVKAAVSLFGEVAFAGDKFGRKPNPSTPEKAFATEAQLHLAQKELNKFKEQLQTAETTRTQSLAELERAKKTVQDLIAKLTVINESKELALKAAKAAKTQTNQLDEGASSDSNQTGKAELERSREQYASAVTELDAAKQELRRIRKEFESSVEAKISAFNQESEARHQAQANASKADHLSKEIAAIQESLVHVKLATDQAEQEESKIRSEKDSTRQSHRLALDESESKSAELKKEFNPKLCKEFELKLSETNREISAVGKRLNDAKASDQESLNSVTTELDRAKEALQKVAEDENSIRSLVESLKSELETVTKRHDELKEKDAETESLVAVLHVKLQNCKAELEAAEAAESRSVSASDDLTSALEQLKSESDSALQEAEATKKEAEELRIETESRRSSLSETEKKLEAALKEAEAAKAAEAQAVEEIRNLSAQASAARSSTGAAAAEITISKEEYESLSRKVEESEMLTRMKVAAAAAQVEAIRAGEAEAGKRLAVVKKEMEEVEKTREEALKRAEMAEAARKAVEGELRRWREKEQKRASEMAERLMTETEASPASVLKAPAALPAVQGRSEGGKKMTKKTSLLPNLGGIFHRKKSGVDGGSPPSHVPGGKEKHA